MHKLSVLLVEDEPKIASSIQQWLSEHEFGVDVAPDGAVGRHLALSKDYALVLLDLTSPLWMVLRFARRFGKTNPIYRLLW